MKRSGILFALGMFVFFWAACQSVVWPQPEPGGVVRPAKSPIDGFWTEVLQEEDGFLTVTLPPAGGPQALDAPKVRLWKISNDKIEVGFEKDGKFRAEDGIPLVLDPGKKPGTIDTFRLDKDAQHMVKGKWLGIYDLKGDYLMICMGGSERPDAFSTSSQPKAQKVQRSLLVLRRGKLEDNPKKQNRMGAGFIVGGNG